MSENIKAISFPELVIGIAGPIGIDIEAICEEVEAALSEVDYEAIQVRVTDEMQAVPAPGVAAGGADAFHQMMYKMDYANQLCADSDDPAFLMRLAMRAIGVKREELLAAQEEVARTKLVGPVAPQEEDEGAVLTSTAFVIRQLKRPEEVSLLRRVYGKQFILISGYGSVEARRGRLIERIKDSSTPSTKDEDLLYRTTKLINRDADEGQDDHVQHLRDTFHLADVFIDGINRVPMEQGLKRFFKAFFGRADIGPTRAEYGMYAAKAASLRSVDLSRQVGAAAFSPNGELIAQGCNEVPKAFGGTYWEGEEPDFRDVKLGYDPNDALKKEVLRDLFESLSKGGLLPSVDEEEATSDHFVDTLLGRGKKPKGAKHFGALKHSQINALTEYGRVVHAEMNVVTDAARLGKPLKDSILFVTTFPCHNCTKHLLASGIRRVIFMEPYPKSRAKQLHDNEIELEKPSETKLSFVPFLGISPFRYRDIFEKSSRKANGKAKRWIEDVPKPMLDVSGPTYIDNERFEVSKLGGAVQPKLI